MRLVKTVSSTLAVIILAAASGEAADRQRDGFWLGVGLGYGSAQVSCDNACTDDDREGSGTAYLRLGGTLSDRLLLGGDVNLWRKSENGATVSLYNVSGTLTFYPDASGGFFLKVGAGLALVDAELFLGDTKVSFDLGKGFGVLAGIGYDIRLSRSVSLTPGINFYGGWPGELGVNNVGVSGWSQNVIDFTVGITFH